MRSDGPPSLDCELVHELQQEPGWLVDSSGKLASWCKATVKHDARRELASQTFTKLELRQLGQLQVAASGLWLLVPNLANPIMSLC